MHVLKVHSDDLDDGYNIVSENETLIQTISLLYKSGMINIKQETFWSYKPSGRSLLLLEPMGRVSGLDIMSSGLMWKVLFASLQEMVLVLVSLCACWPLFLFASLGHNGGVLICNRHL